MPNPDLGTKRQCPSCAARFYDLNHKPITCPKCAFSFEPEALLKPRRSRPGDRAEEPRPVAAVVAVVTETVEAPEPEEAVDEEAAAETGAVEDAEEEVEAEAEPVVAEEVVAEEQAEDGAAPKPTKRRGTTEEVDPDLVEVDEDEEIDDDDEDEDDDTLIEPDDDEDGELDIDIKKEEEDR